MKLRLTGVVQDGTSVAAGVPSNPRTTMEVIQGAAVTIEVTVVRPGGDAVALAGTSPTLTVKKRPQESAILRLVGVPSGNVAVFTLTSAQTRAMQPGLYGYDVWITLAGLLETVVPLSPFRIEAAAYPPP